MMQASRNPPIRMSEEPISVLFVGTTMATGGAEKVMATILRHLDRKRFAPELALLRAEGEQMGLLPHDVPVHGLGLKRVRWMAPALRRLIKRLKPDVVFSMAGGTNVPTILAVTGLKPRPRIVISERNILYIGGMSAYRSAVVWSKRLTYRRADRITAVCDYVRQELCDVFGLPPSRVSTLFNPSVPEDLSERSQQAAPHPWLLSDTHQTIVSAGRLVPEKGHPALLHAFSRITESHRMARLIILGTGPDRLSLEQLARKLGIEALVHFAGFQSDPIPWLAHADLFALASRNEGLCNATIEAMACGIPAVVTDCPGGNRELILPGAGELVPMDDTSALAAALARTLDKRIGRGRCEPAKESATRFRVSAVVQRYADAIVDGDPRPYLFPPHHTRA